MKNNIDIHIEKVSDIGDHFNIIFNVDDNELWKIHIKFKVDKTIQVSHKNLYDELNNIIDSITYITYKDKNTTSLDNWIEQIVLVSKHNPLFFENKLITIQSILNIIKEEELHNLNNYLKCKKNIY